LRALTLTISILLLLCLGASLSGSANSQQKDPPKPQQQSKPKPVQDQDQDEPVRLSSRLVVVPVSVSDAAGQPVKGLTAEDILIEEEGKPQKAVALGEPGKTPIDLALLFDVSGSVQGQFNFEQQAAVQFVKEVLKPSDAVSVFSIGLTPKIMKTRTTSSEEAVTGIMAIAPLKEPTAFFDSVVEAAHYMNKSADPGSRRVLLVISDGEENYSKSYTLNDALREIQKNDCLFYSINPSGGGIRLNNVSLKGQSYMDAMATQTGGKAFNLTKVEELQNVFRQIAEELQAQYLFGYYSSDERNDGSFRRITVRAPKRADLRIRARQGYYVPKA
jgi:Ca-activated chloride channel family protein